MRRDSRLPGIMPTVSRAQFADLGLIGALLPPDVGGFGGTGEDIAVVFEKLGNGLVVEPFLASGVLGAHPIVVAGTEAQKALLVGQNGAGGVAE